ncbi:flippase [Methylicorpusculum oleiharenae]|uniref:flippase n=1 Tax=Methylicorpusculum oleiharenae TaxID=1338687 RepID=UPI0019D1E0C2|nr:flippase [Methylicorpusculum oleiharenae]
MHRPELQKILANTSWLFVDRLLRMGIGLLVGIWVARYLGPEQFGLINYTTAFVALFGAIAGLGLNSIVVRDLIKTPETAVLTMGTAFMLQVFGGFLAAILAIVSIDFVRPGDELIKLMVTILSLSMLFKAADVVKLYFEAQVESKYSVWVENSVFLIFAVARVVLIVHHAQLIVFVWIILGEGIAIAVGLMVMFAIRIGRLRTWQNNFQRAKELLNDSWPLILSGLTISLYMRVDQIMLGQMLGEETVGIYSAAVRISEVWYFIPIAIVNSVFPTLIETKKQSNVLYFQRLQKLYDLMVFLALIVSVPMTFMADWLVIVLFGQAYAQAGTVLAIHIWTGVFVFFGVTSSKWFLIENMQTSAFYRTTLGLIVNIAANFLLIPLYGGKGAAIASLISQVTAAYLFDGINKNTRRSFLLKSAAMLPFIPAIRRRACQDDVTA